MPASALALALFALLLSGCLAEGVAPYPRDDVVMTEEDEPIAIDVLANDEGARELTRLGTLPTLGTIEARRDGTVHYTPNLDTSGEDAFTYVVENAYGSAAARVTVHIEPDDEDIGQPYVLRSGQFWLEPIAARFDRDETPDLVVQDGDQVIALLGDGNEFRELGRWGDLTCCRRHPPLIADLDLDGDTDVVRFDERGDLTIHLVEAAESGEISFEDHVLAHEQAEVEGLRFDHSIPEAAAIGDFDRDGAMDLAVALDAVVPSLVLHSDVSRGRPARSRLLAETPARAMVSGDVTGDGRADVVLLAGSAFDVVTFDDDRVHIARALPPGMRESTQVLIAQLDDDERGELVLIDGTAITVLKLHVRGASLEFESAAIPSELLNAVLADVAGDARPDLVGLRKWSPIVEIWQAIDIDGEPSFEHFEDFSLLGQGAGSPAVLTTKTGDRLLAGRFNDEQGEHELVLFERARR